MDNEKTEEPIKTYPLEGSELLFGVYSLKDGNIATQSSQRFYLEASPYTIGYVVGQIEIYLSGLKERAFYKSYDQMYWTPVEKEMKINDLTKEKE